MSHLVLIDGHHLMYRAYWAIPRTLKTRSGEQVNSVFGMASMILSILKIEKPTHLVVCFDEGDKTFRHQENETYKDGRAETPDDFYVQIPRIQQLIDTWGLPHARNPQYEADDLLCAYAKKGEEAGMNVTIVTGDRDAFQLASEKTRIAIPHSGYTQAEYMGPAEIEAKYGIRPDQVPAYKGLVGDSSDNLPGVKGIGPKGAADLLQKYQTLEGVYEHLADIKPGVRAKLEADREQAFFCQRMALLICDLPLDPPFEQTQLKRITVGPLLAFFQEMEFTLLQRRLREFLSSPYGSALCDEPLPADTASSTAKPAKTESQLSLF
jgi:DNA polymerase-1